MGIRKYLGVALALALASSANAETVCPGGGCDNTTTALPDPGTQSPTTMNTNRAAIEAAVNDNSGRIDGLVATNPITKHFQSPQDGDIVELLGAPFAVTLVGYRCNVTPDAAAKTVPITLQECTSAGCTTVDTGMTCDDKLDTAYDTTITDAAIASGARLRLLLGTPSASMADDGVAIDFYYSR